MLAVQHHLYKFRDLWVLLEFIGAEGHVLYFKSGSGTPWELQLQHEGQGTPRNAS